MFSEDSIRRFTEFVGDTNPLHHDEAATAAMSFGGIIASGIQSMAMMLAVVTELFQNHTPNLGSNRPCGYCGHSAQATVPMWNGSHRDRGCAKLEGWIVTLADRLVRDEGVVAMTATLLYWPGEPACEDSTAIDMGVEKPSNTSK